MIITIEVAATEVQLEYFDNDNGQGGNGDWKGDSVKLIRRRGYAQWRWMKGKYFD